MSFPVNLYTFSKTSNSTLQPGTAGATYNCVLKDSCGIMSPVLGLDLGLSADPSQYNYMYIPAFSRYYYISEWEWSDRLWWAHAEEDTLATWKSYIGDETFYILRAANKFDGNISDDMYPTFPRPTVINTQGSSRPWLPDFDKGYYVIGIINNSDNAVGAVGYYVFDNAQFRTLCNKLLSNTDWLSVPKDFLDGGVDDNLLKTLFNPFQYVVSCNWFPFKPPTGDAVSGIPYGWWQINDVSCSKLSPQGIYTAEVTFPITQHPQAPDRGSYLNCAPFSQMTLTMGPFGTIALDPSNFAGADNVTTETIVDCITGLGLLQIRNPSFESTLNIIDTRTGTFGVPIQLAQMGVDRLTQGETLVSGVAGVVRDAFSIVSQATDVSNLLNMTSAAAGVASSKAQMVSNTAHSIADGIKSSIPQMETTGANGSLAVYFQIPMLQQRFYSLVDEDNPDTGRPLCQLGKPSELGGYMLIRNANIRFPGTINEVSAVRAYLESGFYYE